MFWALPCSIVGVVLGFVLVSLGGSLRRVGHTLEVALTAKEGLHNVMRSSIQGDVL